MKSKASCFSFSKALFMENFRRYWAIPAVMLLIYILGGIFPLMLNYEGDFRNAAGYIENMLIGQNGLFIMMTFAMPVITAGVCFDYLQKSAGTTSVHSMPFSRNRLFNTTVISGYVMAIIPYLITALILLIIARPTYASFYYDEMGIVAAGAADVFSRSEILYWIVETLVTSLFVYSIAVFAAIISGTGVMQSIMALCWNWLAPALGAVTVYFAAQFLHGYSENWSWVIKTSPTICAAGVERISTLSLIIYVLVALVILVISEMLYMRRKLEKTGDAIVFAWMRPVLCCLLSLFTMVLGGIYFEALNVLDNGDIALYTGYLVGAVIGYLVASIIVYKTARVFNMKTLKGLLIYCLIAVIIICAFAVDITGYSKRLPSAGSVSSVDFNGVNACQHSDWGRYDSSYFENDSDAFNYYGGVSYFRFKEPENIDRIIAIQDYLVNHKELSYGNLISDRPEDVYESSVNIAFDYDLKVSSMKREYRISQTALAEIPEMEELYMSDEFKDFYSFYNMKSEGLESIDVCNRFTGEGTVFYGSDAEDLMAALEKDFRARTLAEALDYRNETGANVTISYKVTNTDKDGRTWEGNPCMGILVRKSDVNTIAWFAQHGLPGVTEISPDLVKYMDVYYDYESMLTIDDPDMIAYIIKHGQLDLGNLNSYAVVQFECYGDNPHGNRTWGEIERDYNNGKITWEEYDRLTAELSSVNRGTLYMKLNEVPESILNQMRNSKVYADFGYNFDDYL